MNPRRSIRATIALVAVLATLSACRSSDAPPAAPAPAVAASGPNVILFLSDALRAASLSLYGYPRETTPRLAELAREGIVFENHFAHFPGTPISVSQMLTGRLSTPLFVGFDYLAVPMHGEPERLLVLPRALSDHGYRTGIVSSHYWFHNSDRLLREFESRDIVREPSEGKSYAEFDRLAPAITRFLDAGSNDPRPFFLYVHSMDTHGPNTGHAGFPDESGDLPAGYAEYDAEIRFTDHWIGAILDDLKRRGLLENTIVAVTSDHGDDFGEMGPEPWNRDHGRLVRRSQVHIPLLLRLPNAKRAGHRYSGMTGQIDLAPTLLALATGADSLAPYDVDGLDLGPDLEAPPATAAARTLVAFSSRYWGIYEPDVELHYDTWTQTYSSLLRVTPDAFHYPRLTAVDDEVRRQDLLAKLDSAREREVRQQAELPPLPAAEQPKRFGLAAFLPVDPQSDAGPTFEDSADDDLWALPGTFLRAQPDEHPPAVVLVSDFLAGAYRVTAILDHTRISGYAHEFDVSFPGARPEKPIRVTGHAAIEKRRVDLGVLQLPDPLRIRIANPRGGVSIGGFEFERQSDVSAPPIDPEAKERLRQLGYE